VLNVVSFSRAGSPLASSTRIAKITFTGSDRPYQSANMRREPDPGTLELERKSPIFLQGRDGGDDAYLDKGAGRGFMPYSR
jgi:acyl-CoA reductase-like NAD-dependent aldehyde dehydrogenase